MRIDQATQQPLVIDFGAERLSIPRFTLRDWLEWGAELDATRRKELTAGMTPMERFKALSLFPPPPSNLWDLRSRTLTGEGMDRICRVCLGRANVLERAGQRLAAPEPIAASKADAIFAAAMASGDAEALAVLLASAADESKSQRVADPQPTLADEEDADPLPPTSARPSSG